MFGFMGKPGAAAGFGNAFSQAYNRKVAAVEQQENDLFKIKYSDFLRTRDERTATEKETREMSAQAADLAKRYNDPEAAGFIFNQIKLYGLDATQENLQQGLLHKDPNYVPSDPAGSEELPVNKETDYLLNNKPKGISTAGLDRINRRLDEATGGEYSKLATGHAETSPYDGMDVGGYSFGTPEATVDFQSRAEHKYMYEEAVRKGDMVEAMKQERILSALRWSAVEELRIKAAENGNKTGPWTLPTEDGELFMGRYRTPTGAYEFTTYKPVKTPEGTMYQLPDGSFARETLREFTPLVTQEELTDRSALAKDIEGNPNYKELFVKTAETSAALQTATVMKNLLVNEDGTYNDFILSTSIANVTQFADDLVREVETATDLAGMLNRINEDLTSGEISAETDATMKKVKEELESRVSSGEIQGELARRSLFMANEITLAYTLGRISDPGGRLNKTDVDNFMNALKTSKRPEAYLATMNNLIGGAIAKTEDVYRAFLNGSNAKEAALQFNGKYGYVPRMLLPLKDVIASSENPELMQSYEEAVASLSGYIVTEDPVEDDGLGPMGEEFGPPMETPQERIRRIYELRKARGDDKTPETSAPGAKGRKARRDK